MPGKYRLHRVTLFLFLFFVLCVLSSSSTEFHSFEMYRSSISMFGIDGMRSDGRIDYPPPPKKKMGFTGFYWVLLGFNGFR